MSAVPAPTAPAPSAAPVVMPVSGNVPRPVDRAVTVSSVLGRDTHNGELVRGARRFPLPVPLNRRRGVPGGAA